MDFSLCTDSGVEFEGEPDGPKAARSHRLAGIQAALRLRPRRALSSAEAKPE
jgi:hypothetical protein